MRAIVAQSPFRHMTTPGGYQMSVAMTNCGERGWVTDHTGYRYDPIDPRTGAPWPAMPPVFRDLARRAAEQAGFEALRPTRASSIATSPARGCRCIRTRTSMDYSAPIVSVSLGLPATFLFGGMARSDKPRRFRLVHGDVVVWGGPSRLAYHGVAPLADGEHALLGRKRINLTFRRTR